MFRIVLCAAAFAFAACSGVATSAGDCASGLTCVASTVTESDGGDASSAPAHDAGSAAGVDAGSSAGRDAAVSAAVSVAVDPSLVSVAPSGRVNLLAQVTGSANTSVTWSLLSPGSPTAGTIDSSGVYTAPSATGTFNVVATSVADTSKTGVATVNVVTPSSTDTTGLISDDRRTTWNPGLNAVGGIPNRTTACASLSPSGGDDTSAVQKAINACASGQVVQLAAGTYNLSTAGTAVTLKSNVTVRGAVDATGRPSTKFVMPNTKSGGAFSFGAGGPDQGFLRQAVSLTADGVKGANSVTVASNPGYVVGEVVTVDQLYDPSLVWLNPDHFNDPMFTNNASGTEDNRMMFCRTNRMMGQAVEIQSISGSGPFTLTFTTPLHTTFSTTQTAQVVRHSSDSNRDVIVTAPVKYAGLENVAIEGGGSNGAVTMTGTEYCWLKNIEVSRWHDPGITFTRTVRCVLRDSYIHQTQEPSPGSGGYALDINWESADNLVENNIVWAANKVIVMRASGGGNVIGYNYFEDGFGASYLTIPETGVNASHFAGSRMELIEGNQSWNLGGDGVWGNALWITFFRNNATGLRRNVNGTPYTDNAGVLHSNNNFQNDSGGRAMVNIAATHDYYNFVGNVLGYSGMPAPTKAWSYEYHGLSSQFPTVWVIGTTTSDVQATQAQSDATYARILRHGNYDYAVNNATVWDATIARHDLPPSLYLTTAPTFFGSNAWPWVTPEGTTPLATLPARARFDSMSH